MESVLRVENVKKYFTQKSKKLRSSGKTVIRAVDGVSFEVKAGEIYGLLGPNGAGKSTIIKIIAGLIGKDGGKVYVDGYDIDTKRKEASGNIGAIIEMPTLFNRLSAIDNLRYFATLEGGIDEKRIDDVLELVGLKGREKDKFSSYSLGMKQRLGIAQAVMGRPKLLILDEPTNGLDPEWIIKMRELLKRLASEYNIAILVSSHILSEMQALCDRVGILINGCLINEVNVDDIGKMNGEDKTVACFVSNDPAAVGAIMQERGLRYETKDNKVFVELKEEDMPDVTKAIVMQGVNIYGVETKKRTLEDLFRSIISKGNEKTADPAVEEKEARNADEML